MIEFHYETNFKLSDEKHFTDWLSRVIISEDGLVTKLDYIFCDDQYLLGINKKYLGHDTFTDIISFGYAEGKVILGDIFISVDRVRENALKFEAVFEQELLRVMVHGLLHFMGFNDKTEGEATIMRAKENEKIKMFHVEQ